MAHAQNRAISHPVDTVGGVFSLSHPPRRIAYHRHQTGSQGRPAQYRPHQETRFSGTATPCAPYAGASAHQAAEVGNPSTRSRVPASTGGACCLRGNLMDSMIDALANPRVAPPAGKSRMDVWVETLAPERQEAVLAAAASRAWGHADLLTLLQSYGAPEIADTSFGAWRRKKGLPRVS